jgi:hypothetical protein
MKLLITILSALWLAIVLSEAQTIPYSAWFTGHTGTLTIRADGSSEFKSEGVMPRKLVEQQVRRWERSKDADEDAEAGQTTETIASNSETNAAYSDQQLQQKYREQLQDQDDGANPARIKVEVAGEAVRVETVRPFSSLEDLLGNAREIWWRAGVMTENVRLESTNGLLQVTFFPAPISAAYAKRIRLQWKQSGLTNLFVLNLPGKIISSGFPQTATNSTWFLVNPKQEETLDLALKLQEKPLVVTAELGGLKIEQPLESKTLQPAARSGPEAGSDLPLTDAGPGFQTEALGLTITTLHLFPEGEKHFKASPMSEMQGTGVVVNAKLFAPKGRSLLFTENPRVVQAKDNQGRKILLSYSESEHNRYSRTSSFSSEDSEDANSTQISLPLALPQADAESIDELVGEVTVVTAGSWKKMSLTNVQQNATNEIDLSKILPGATLILKTLSLKPEQLQIQAIVKGPPAVTQLAFTAEIPGREGFNSHSYDQNSRTTGNKTTRTVSIQGYSFGSENKASSGTVNLIVRIPEERRREKVRFTLQGLDLL